MKVLLREDISRVGKSGEVVNVAPGFARNYLLPKKLAVIATEQNLKAQEADRRRAEKLAAQQREQLRELARQLEETSCTIMAKAGEGGHLFGSVAAVQIAEAFQKDGLAVEEHMVQLESPIRELGVYPIQLKLHADVTCTTKVWVVAE